MTLVKREFNISIELDNVIGSIATKCGVEPSYLVTTVLMNNEKIMEALKELREAEDIPDYKGKDDKTN